MEAGYGSGFASTVLKGWNKDTLGSYMRQIKRLARTEHMRPGDGPRAVVECRLLAIEQADQSESSAKAVLSAARLVEKMGWMPRVVRPSDWHLVTAIELQKSKEDRAAAKEWAQIDDLIRVCEAARSPSDWEAVALACLSVGHCLRRSEAGGPVGQGGKGIQFFGAKSTRGGAAAGAGALGAGMVTISCQAQGAQRLPPRQGGVARVGRGARQDARLHAREGGGGKKRIRWHAFRRLGAAQLKHMGAPMPTIMLWGGWKTPGVARMYIEAPPPVEVRQNGGTPLACVGGAGG